MITTAVVSACRTTAATESTTPAANTEPQASEASSPSQIAEGQRVFRFETFGDEVLWTDKLHLTEVVEKSVDPTTALKIGLKVDSEVLAAGILQKVDLKSPVTTVALLKMNAVVGLQATVDANNHITRLGVTCALCHSNVDNSVMALVSLAPRNRRSRAARSNARTQIFASGFWFASDTMPRTTNAGAGKVIFNS